MPAITVSAATGSFSRLAEQRDLIVAVIDRAEVAPAAAPTASPFIRAASSRRAAPSSTRCASATPEGANVALTPPENGG